MGCEWGADLYGPHRIDLRPVSITAFPDAHTLGLLEISVSSQKAQRGAKGGVTALATQIQCHMIPLCEAELFV